MAASCAARSRGAADPRSGTKSAVMGSWLLYGLHGSVWSGACAAGAVLGRDWVADCGRDLCRCVVFQYFAGRLERGGACAACPGGWGNWSLNLSVLTVILSGVDRFALRIGQRSRRIPGDSSTVRVRLRIV